MLILDETNTIRDTDSIGETCYYGVLRFKDMKNPDYYFEKLDEIESFLSHTMKLQIGTHIIYVPLHWTILCSDYEYAQTIPLCEFNGNDFQAVCMNPIDGFMMYYERIRILEIFENTTWSCPPIQDKDMLVVPIGPHPKGVDRGPLCVILSPNKLDINVPISDII